MLNKEIFKSKTFWASVTAIVGAVAGYMTGEVDLNTLLSVAVPALVGIFLRDGMLTQGKEVKKDEGKTT